jgi:aconitate hydratase
MEKTANPFAHLKQELKVGDETFNYFNLQDLKDERLQKLPFSIRVLLESAIRNCDDFNIKRKLP